MRLTKKEKVSLKTFVFKTLRDRYTYTVKGKVNNDCRKKTQSSKSKLPAALVILHKNGKNLHRFCKRILQLLKSKIF